MKRWIGRLASVVLMIVTSASPEGRLSSAMPPPPANVAPRVLAVTEGGAPALFLVVLRDQADLHLAAPLPTKAAKGHWVYETLRQTALRTQAPLRAELDHAGIRYRPHYIVNMLEIIGD